MSTPRRMRAVTTVAVALTVAAASAATAQASPTRANPSTPSARPAAHRTPSDVQVQLLSISDFHSGTPMPSQVAGLAIHYSDGRVIPWAGTPYLSTQLTMLRGEYRNTVTWSNGDDMTSYNFSDKGTGYEFGAEMYNRLGMEFSVVGNHDMDMRIDTVRQVVQPGGCRKQGFIDCLPTSTGKLFPGLNSPFISSNLVWTASGRHVWQSYAIREFVQNGHRYKVGIIGATVQGSERWPMSYNEKITSTERVAAIDAASDELARRGVTAQVLSIHDGASDSDALADTCVKVTGPAIDVARRVSPRIAAIVTGHTHKLFNCRVAGPDGTLRPVVQAGSYGQATSQIVLTLDGRTGQVKRDKTVSNLVPTTTDVTPDASVQAISTYWTAYAKQRANTVIARTSGSITLARNEAGEQALGDVAADAMLWSSRQPGNPRADLALVSTRNGADESGWNSLTHADITGVKQGDGSLGITYQNAFESFGQDAKILTVRLTGEQIIQALQQQWQGQTFSPLAVSANVHYSYWADTTNQHVRSSTLTIDGRPVRPGKVYRVALDAADALAPGMNANTALTMGWKPQAHKRFDDQTIVEYLRARGSITVPLPNRVTRLA